MAGPSGKIENVDANEFRLARRFGGSVFSSMRSAWRRVTIYFADLGGADRSQGFRRLCSQQFGRGPRHAGGSVSVATAISGL